MKPQNHNLPESAACSGGNRRKEAHGAESRIRKGAALGAESRIRKGAALGAESTEGKAAKLRAGERAEEKEKSEQEPRELKAGKQRQPVTSERVAQKKRDDCNRSSKFSP